MKQLIKNYTFNAASRLVTFTDFSSISLDRLYLITNVTAGTVIYQFNNPNLGGAVSGNVLTLTLDTSSMSNGDRLQIIYDSATGDPVYDSASGASAVQGNSAAITADSGNPVKIGGVYNTTMPLLGSGQRGDMQLDANGRQVVTLGTALSQAIDSVLSYPRGSNYSQTSGSTIILTGAGKLTGIWVSAASATPTIKVWDNTAASGTVVVDTFTPVASTMYTFPAIRVGTGIFVSLSGTVNCTVLYDPTVT